VATIAHDTEHFTSKAVIVSDFRGFVEAPVGYAPPITSDPPFHQEARRLLLPAFSPKAVALLETFTRAFCVQLLDEIAASGATEFDAAVEYAQHIPVQVIAHMLGVPPEEGDRFRLFIHRILEAPGQTGPVEPEDTLSFYLWGLIEQRRAEPGDDLISYLLTTEIEGRPLDPEHIVGTCALLLLAGIDTTWSAIGASLWHLANHPEDRRRLVAEPELVPTAVEEFLRAYAPVTMARKVLHDTEVAGCPVHAGEQMLLTFPAANHDPAAFDDADEFQLDREKNRHVAFGLGIHRCIGSNLARLEMLVALQEWLRAFPNYSLDPAGTVTWANGQVRGPRAIPVLLNR
jgi:cytochrome P450